MLLNIVATRFELATSASRTQRSTKLSHATIQDETEHGGMPSNYIINKKRLIVKEKTHKI